MLKSTLRINKEKIDIEKYNQLSAFLKSNSRGYRCTKAKPFTREEVYRFLQDAPNDRYLAHKVSNLNQLT